MICVVWEYRKVQVRVLSNEEVKSGFFLKDFVYAYVIYFLLEFTKLF